MTAYIWFLFRLFPYQFLKKTVNIITSLIFTGWTVWPALSGMVHGKGKFGTKDQTWNWSKNFLLILAIFTGRI